LFDSTIIAAYAISSVGIRRIRLEIHAKRVGPVQKPATCHAVFAIRVSGAVLKSWSAENPTRVAFRETAFRRSAFKDSWTVDDFIS